MNSEEFKHFTDGIIKSLLKSQMELYKKPFYSGGCYTGGIFILLRNKERWMLPAKKKLHALVWKTTNKGRDYLRKSYVKRE